MVAGYAEDGLGGERFAAVRLNTDGTLDNGFDGDGVVLITIEGHDQAHGVVVQPDGRIVLGGYAHTGEQRVFASVRMEANGTLDPAFDGDGRMTVHVGAVQDNCYDLAMSPGGDLALVGYSDGDNAADFAVVMVLSGLNLGVMDPYRANWQVMVHPNPVMDRAELRIVLELAVALDPMVVDAAGRAVLYLDQARMYGAGAHEIPIDLTGLAPGHYSLVLGHGHCEPQVRFLKQ